jgi:hypothetical protein|tara:strand:+ start:569 stop:1192 length:624 start_codon:yes stop_codon:yes gene_type:complete
MKISYAITVCNEFVEIQKLIPFLLEHKRHEDEIVILYDSKNGSKSIEQFLRAKSINGEFSWHKGEFNGHFANWKNKLTNLCKGDYIFQIDADEMVTLEGLTLIPKIIENNLQVEVYRVPRINTVEGLTQKHVQKWGWRVDEKGWVNFPDLQWRIYKNNSKIKWKNKVHEVLEGYEMYSELPRNEELCLIHNKTIEKQEKQNNYYNTL